MRRDRAWLDALPVALLVMDDSGAVAELNSAGAELLGYERDELVGRPIQDVFADEAMQWILGVDSSADARCRSHARHRTGLEIPVELGLVASEDRSVVVYLTDLRDREALSVALERAGHNERLSSLGRIAASVAHEINNPLSYVTANLDVAAQCIASGAAAAPDGRPLRDFIVDSQQGAWRVARLVRQLLRVARDRGGDEPHTDVRLADVVRTASSMVRAEIMEARYIERLDEDLPPLAADETQLAQVVVNLLMNAAQAIATAPAKETHEIVVTTRARGDRQELWVEDTGPGVPLELRARVCDPFFTTKASGVGTGLGLSICADIVARHQGVLRVEEADHGGARFVVDLPAKRAAAVLDDPRAAASATPTPARILFIDDEDSLRRAWSRLLDPHEVVALAPREALERVVAQGDHRFDVVLCDLMMPEVDGIDVYEQLREHAPELTDRFVVVTGGAVGVRARQFLQDVACPRINKPAPRREIVAVVEQVLRKASPQQREPAPDSSPLLAFRPAPMPPDEPERLRAVRALRLLDTPPEPRFDRLVRMATRLFRVPIALVVLVDAERQWFKAGVGLEVDQTSRHVSFCGHCLLGSGTLVVDDAREDPRFAGNPLVVGPPKIRFYAGQALHSEGGSRVGTLCIIDRIPRQLEEDERELLADLAAMAERELLPTSAEVTSPSSRAERRS